MSDEQQIKQLLLDYTESVKHADDIEYARKIWTSDANIATFIHPRGTEEGLDTIFEQFYNVTMNKNFTDRNLRIVKGPHIHLLDENSAFAVFFWEFDAVNRDDGSKKHTEGRETQILRRENGKWKILHVHYSGNPTTAKGEGF